jgi:hypothetical protein
MNWYKLSFPIIQKKPSHYYDSIGHYEDREYLPVLWAIDQNEKFYEHEIDLDKGYITHSTLIIDGDFPKNPMATGRYDPKTKTCSVIFYYNNKWKKMSPQEQYQTQKKVEEILDRIFKNPNIIVFN